MSLLERISARLAGMLLRFLLMGSLMSLTACQSGEPADPSVEDYRSFLSVTQVKSYYHTEPNTQLRYPLVQGSLVNLGGQTLIVVEFTLRFKDNLHQVIHEERAYPVYVSEFAPQIATKPLGPGQKTRFAFKTPKCPPSWSSGDVEIEITKVAFAK